jgi:hypothetical protein
MPPAGRDALAPPTRPRTPPIRSSLDITAEKQLMGRMGLLASYLFSLVAAFLGVAAGGGR